MHSRLTLVPRYRAKPLGVRFTMASLPADFGGPVGTYSRTAYAVRCNSSKIVFLGPAPWAPEMKTGKTKGNATHTIVYTAQNKSPMTSYY